MRIYVDTETAGRFLVLVIWIGFSVTVRGATLDIFSINLKMIRQNTSEHADSSGNTTEVLHDANNESKAAAHSETRGGEIKQIDFGGDVLQTCTTLDYYP